jgi:hypothetical protein
MTNPIFHMEQYKVLIIDANSKEHALFKKNRNIPPHFGQYVPVHPLREEDWGDATAA